MRRAFYTLIQLIKHYRCLRARLRPRFIFKQITCIDRDVLHDLGVRYVALDFDGVLNSHAEPLPTDEVTLWLTTLVSQIGEENCFILSNKPLKVRVDFFKRYFPKIRFIQQVRKKPYPDGLEKIFALKGLNATEHNQVALVDDRIATGMLATCISGCRGLYIVEPYVQLKKRPISESFFLLLRWLERRLFIFSHDQVID